MSQTFKFSNVSIDFTDMSLLLNIVDKGASVPINLTDSMGDLYLSYLSKKESTRWKFEMFKIYSHKIELDEDVLKFYILYIFDCVLFFFSIYKVSISMIDIVDDFENLSRFN